MRYVSPPYSEIEETFYLAKVATSNFLFLVNGKWSPWSIFGQCTKTCGGGVKHRSRKCDNPAPANGGKNCRGPSKQSHECNTFPCPGK